MLAASSTGRARFALATSLILAHATSAVAHGFAGDRFFPATILTPDPFVADEMSLPTAIINPPSPDGSREIDLEADLAKRYLQHHVKDIGLSAPFDRLVPLVEVSFSTAVNRGFGGQTVGTIQPGVIWFGQYVQVGAEAIIPASRLAGHGYGGVVQLHFYLDDIFPNSIGRPLFRY